MLGATTALVAAIASVIPGTGPASPAGDGLLLQRVLVAAYLRAGRDEQARLAVVEREVRQFEAFLWRDSDRQVRVEATLVEIPRDVRPEELEGPDPRWGYALGRNARVVEDLEKAGVEPGRFDALILLFDPPRERACLAAGLTWHSERYSSIPLKENLFEDAGHHYPLHLVMVHEYLHQLDSAFEAAGRSSGFEDPDRLGGVGDAACVLPGDQYPFFRTALQHDEMCRPTQWRALDGLMGTWISR